MNDERLGVLEELRRIPADLNRSLERTTRATLAYPGYLHHRVVDVQVVDHRPGRHTSAGCERPVGGILVSIDALGVAGEFVNRWLRCRTALSSSRSETMSRLRLSVTMSRMPGSARVSGEVLAAPPGPSALPPTRPRLGHWPTLIVRGARRLPRCQARLAGEVGFDDEEIETIDSSATATLAGLEER